MADFVHPEFLVETDWLAQHLNDPDVLVFDCTTHLIPDPKITYQVVPGREDFEKGHIPGAQFVDMLRDVSDTSQKLRFMRQTPDDFAAAMRRFGVNNTTRVVTYSTRQCLVGDAAVVAAARVRPRQCRGAERRLAEMAARRPSGRDRARRAAHARRLHRARGAQPDGRQGRGAGGDRRWRDLHAQRAAAGSSTQAPAATATAGRAASPAASTCRPRICSIRRPTRSCRPTNCGGVRRGRRDGRQVITYCGGGIAASADALALIMLGHKDVKLYDASLSEWAKDPSLPMETG